MSSMVGFLDSKSAIEDAKKRIKAMAESLAHEEWHHIYTYISPPLYLAKIDIGLLNTESSPVKSTNGEYEVFLIGEFYTPNDIRESTLKDTKCEDISDDNQFLLSIFQKYDLQFVNYVEGDFLAVIWQPKLKRMIIAGDRFGHRNLFYHELQNKVIFCSEVKAILKYSDTFTIDSIGAFQSLYFGHLVGDRTLFHGIKYLQADEIILFEKNRFQLMKRNSYYFKEDFPKYSNNDWEEKLAYETRQSILDYCKGDLKTAITLSGGLDSRIVLAGFPKSYYPLHAYTWGVPNHHEAKIAAKICNKLGVEHTIYQTPFTDFLDRIKKIVFLTDGMLPAITSFHNLNNYLIRKSEDMVFCGLTLFGYYKKLPALKNKLSVSDIFHHLPFEEVTKLFRKEFHDSIIENLNECLQPKIRDLNYQNHVNTIDHMKLYCRKRRQVNMGVVVMRNFTEVRMPLSSERLLKLVTSMPLEVRQNRKIYEKALFHINENVWRIPEDKTILFSYKTPFHLRQKIRFLIDVRNRGSSYLQRLLGLPLYLGNYPIHNIPKLFMTDKNLQHDLKEFLTGPQSRCKEYLNMPAVEIELKNQFNGKYRQMPQITFLLTFEYWLRLFVK